jgi:cytosine/adenosine deaminase-related metal-dependent hydrolase
MIDLIIDGGTIITINPEREILEGYSIAINDGRILDIDVTEVICQKYPAKEHISAKDKIVLPGLVDAHGHAGHGLIKTIASDTPSFWSELVTNTYFHYTTDEFWYVEGRLSALERLKAGITCGLSVIGSQPRSDDKVFASNHAKAYAELGIREAVAVGPCSPPWPVKVSRWKDGKQIQKTASFDQLMAATEEVIQEWNHKADDRIRVFVTPFLMVASMGSKGPTPPDLAPVLTEDDLMMTKAVRELAAKYNTRIHSDAFGGMVSLASRDPNGLLGPDVSLQHCNGLSLDEIEILAKTDTRVGHVASSSHAIARTPVPELIKAGVTVAVTTDGTAPKRPFDLFQMARMAQLIHQYHFRDPYYLPAGKLLEMITIDAARALGWDDQIGSLEKGKKADIITIDMRQPHLTPNFMPVHRIVYETVGNDVADVVVNGKILMKDREVLGIDEDQIIDAANEEALALIERADLHRFTKLPKNFWGHGRMTMDEKLFDQN